MEVIIGEVARELFGERQPPDGQSAKLPEAERLSIKASSEKLNAAKKTLSFFELRFPNFSMLILTIIGKFFAKKKLLNSKKKNFQYFFYKNY